MQSVLSNVAHDARCELKALVRASPWKILIWIAEPDEATAADWLIRQSRHAGKADATRSEKFFFTLISARASAILASQGKQLQKRLTPWRRVKIDKES